MHWVDGIKHISVLIGIWVAIAGINAWRKEHVGKRQVELAEEILALFYEANDAIRHMRSPMGFGHEMQDVERQEGESDAQFQARQNASVVFHRYNQYQEMFSRLHASRYRFMALIGQKEAKPFDELRSITNKIISAARMLARLWPQDHHRTEEQQHKHWDRIGKQEAIFWEGLEEDDPINPVLDKTIAEMEATCRRIIAGRSSFADVLNWRLW